MKFNTPEEALAYAMSIPPKPKRFRQKGYNRITARIGRYDWLVSSPDFGKYYVDIQGPFGSDNRGAPEYFLTYESAASYLLDRGFEPVN